MRRRPQVARLEVDQSGVAHPQRRHDRGFAVRRVRGAPAQRVLGLALRTRGADQVSEDEVVDVAVLELRPPVRS